MLITRCALGIVEGEAAQESLGAGERGLCSSMEMLGVGARRSISVKRNPSNRHTASVEIISCHTGYTLHAHRGIRSAPPHHHHHWVRMGTGRRTGPLSGVRGRVHGALSPRDAAAGGGAAGWAGGRPHGGRRVIGACSHTENDEGS